MKLLELNKDYATDNKSIKDACMMRSLESYLSAEIAYAAAKGENHVSIDCNHIISFETSVKWQNSIDSPIVITPVNASIAVSEIMESNSLTISQWFDDYIGDCNVRYYADNANMIVEWE